MKRSYKLDAEIEPDAKRAATGRTDGAALPPPSAPSLDEMLARQLPCLVPIEPTEPCSLNALIDTASSPDFFIGSRRIATLALRDSAATSDGEQSMFVDLSVRSLRDPSRITTSRPLELRPYCRPAESAAATSLKSVTVMSLAQVLRLIKMPAELVPPELLQRVRLSDVRADVVVDTATGVALYVQGGGQCGPCRGDHLSFFNRLAPPPNPHVDTSSQYCVRVRQMVQTPLNRWLLLQCSGFLNAAVFPQLAALTHGRCLDPEYVYALCETEGGVELDEQQRVLLYVRQADRWYEHYRQPFAPINAVCVLTPHSPSGCLQLPVSALAAVATPVAPFAPPPALTAATPARATCLLVDLQLYVVELLYDCVSYLDTNSLLFGLLPAMHSLSAVTAALADPAYARRVLLARFGAVSDCALWSEALLSEWRGTGFVQQRADISERYGAYVSSLRQVDRDEMRARRLEVHWAAVFDLQARVNRFLIRVMLQAKEHTAAVPASCSVRTAGH